MSALSDQRLGELRQAKLRALVRARFEILDSLTDTFRDGATLLGADGAFVLIESATEASLGGALVWFTRNERPVLHVIVDASSEVAAVLARQAQWWAPPVTLWRLEGTAMVEVHAAPPPGPPTAAPSGAEALVEMLDAEGLDVVVDHGVIRGEVLGLEVARITDGAQGPVLEVGVGRFDREISSMLHSGVPTADALHRAAELVRAHRRRDAPRHPLRDLVPERWVRALVLADPSMVDATTLAPCDMTVEPLNLRVRQPAAAVGMDPTGHGVVVVCSAGFDLDVVALAADTRQWHDPDARLVVAVAASGPLSILEDLATLLRRPATLVRLDPLFATGAP